jgi:hypothetical protein
MGLVFHPSSDHTRTDVDSIAADIFSPPSSTAVDGAVRTARAASSHAMSSTRKSFSSVLQRVPTAVGRSISSEADDVRSVKHAEDGPQSKETRGLNASPKTEQSDVSPSRTEERSRSSDDGEKIAEGSKTDDEFATVGSDVHSEVQVQVPAPILSMSHLNQYLR